jgi:hypothetical protein
MEGFVSDFSEKIIAKSECAGCKYQVAAKKRWLENRESVNGSRVDFS